MTLAASALFEPGEAMLTPRGAAKLQAIAWEAAEKKRIVVLTSVGEDKAGHRFDRWELGAARLAAAARALHETGLEEGRIVIRGLDESDAPLTGVPWHISCLP
jgi:flagellar motor protein MotB